MSNIQFWRFEDWTMVYKDGILVLSGDHYHADEWLQTETGVTVVDDEAGVCIPDGHNAITQLSEVMDQLRKREDRIKAAEQLREKAAGLLAEAQNLESQK